MIPPVVIRYLRQACGDKESINRLNWPAKDSYSVPTGGRPIDVMAWFQQEVASQIRFEYRVSFGER